MEHYLILARSVTYAQRMQRALVQAGIRCQIARAPRELTDLGCAYVVRVAPNDLAMSLTILHRERLYPVRVFSFQHDGYREVGSV